jgi:fumarate reductase flavoprotein subunit
VTDSSYDVVVIGGGLAGLVAANRAAQLGRRTILLEKGAEEKYLCNSRLTYGTLHINYAAVETDEDVLVQRIESATGGFARKDLARTIAKDGRRLIQWLRSEAVEMVSLGEYNTNVLSPPARTGFGLTWKGYAGDVALQRLEENFRKRQGRFQRGTRAKALQLAGGGVRIETEGGEAFRAAAVVIADGGFTANTDMLREHIGPAPEKLIVRNGGTAMGDGLRMAQALGARIDGLSNFYGHLHAREALHSDRLWPRPYADELAAAAIVIDQTGRRVADEGLGGIWLSNAVARLPDPLATTAIFDHAIWEGAPGRGHVQPPNPLLLEAGATLHRAETIAALAPMIGLAPERLQETVDHYNAALDAGTLGSLSPPRSERHKPWPIRTAPFYALPLSSGITNTMGGIVIDGDARVLDTEDKPIPGLYAAGATIGGLDGGPHAGYVGGLIKATFGLRAAETIAGKS